MSATILDATITVLSAMTVPNLRADAKARGIKGFSSMNKSALVDAIAYHDAITNGRASSPPDEQPPVHAEQPIAAPTVENPSVPTEQPPVGTPPADLQAPTTTPVVVGPGLVSDDLPIGDTSVVDRYVSHATANLRFSLAEASIPGRGSARDVASMLRLAERAGIDTHVGPALAEVIKGLPVPSKLPSITTDRAFDVVASIDALCMEIVGRMDGVPYATMTMRALRAHSRIFGVDIKGLNLAQCRAKFSGLPIPPKPERAPSARAPREKSGPTVLAQLKTLAKENEVAVKGLDSHGIVQSLRFKLGKDADGALSSIVGLDETAVANDHADKVARKADGLTTRAMRDLIAFAIEAKRINGKSVKGFSRMSWPELRDIVVTRNLLIGEFADVMDDNDAETSDATDAELVAA